MGGFRHEGQVRSCATDMGQFDPTDLEDLLNFAVPSKAVLSTDIVHTSPGIALSILDTVAESQSQNTTYTICVDGKNVNTGRGKLGGDVNLFGYEQRLTFEKRQTRLTRETDVITSTTDTVENIIHQQVEKVNMSDKQVTYLFEPFIKIIALLGHRLKDLKQCTLSEMKALEQFQQWGSQEMKQDWRTSKFGYVISAMQTYVFQLNILMIILFMLQTAM
jgi:hypothetical protein